MKTEVITIKRPEGDMSVNVIIGISHFIKTVTDIYETLRNAKPEIKFGLAFCEASGPRLIRTAGTDDEMMQLAIENAQKIAAGHSFVLFLKDTYPVNILGSLRNVPEIVNLLCATANPLEVVVAQTEQGRGILGVIDGGSPLGVETDKDKASTQEFLKKIGYKM